MCRSGVFLALGCLVAGVAEAAEGQAPSKVQPALTGLAEVEATSDTEVHRSTSLRTDEKMDIHPLKLERVTLFEVSGGAMRISIRAGPGGLVELRPSGAAAKIWILGPTGGTTSFTLHGAEQVAFWPIRKLEVHARSAGFALMAVAADTAFVLRADRTTAAGLRVRCDSESCSLSQGQRLDVNRENGQTRSRVIGSSWPGEIMRETEAPSPGPEDERAKPGLAATMTPTEQAPVGIGLPVIATGLEAWEVTAAQPASP